VKKNSLHSLLDIDYHIPRKSNRTLPTVIKIDCENIVDVENDNVSRKIESLNNMESTVR